MNKRTYKLIITEVSPSGAVYEGSIETDFIASVRAYLDFYEETTAIEEGETDVM